MVLCKEEEERLLFRTEENNEVKMINIRVEEEVRLETGFETFVSKNGQLLASVMEVCGPSYSMVVSKGNGSKPYAVKTVDGPKDDLGAYKLAQVQVQKGYNLIFMLNDTEGRKAKTVIVMQVEDISREYLTVRVTYKDLSSSLTYPKNLRRPIVHLSTVIDKHKYPAPLVDKYSYNTKRVTRYALLRYSEEEGLVGEREIRGKERKILFNKNSLKDIELKEGDVYLCRIFYSVRFEGREVIVDGYIIKEDDVYNVDPDDAIRYSRAPEEVIDRTKRATLTNGRSVIIQYNSIGVLRMLYNIDGNIRSFNLSNREYEFIESVSDVS